MSQHLKLFQVKILLESQKNSGAVKQRENLNHLLNASLRKSLKSNLVNLEEVEAAAEVEVVLVVETWRSEVKTCKVVVVAVVETKKAVALEAAIVVVSSVKQRVGPREEDSLV